jgi:hypothetical protein
VLGTEVFQQLGLGGAAPSLALSATGADEHRARKWCGGGSGCVDGSNGVGWCRRRWRDSGIHWSLSGGCVVDQGPPHAIVILQGRAVVVVLAGVGVSVGKGEGGGTPVAAGACVVGVCGGPWATPCEGGRR